MNMRIFSGYKKGESGLVIMNVLVFAAIAATVTISLVNWGSTVLKSAVTLTAREQAFQIAEAGIEYYRWHLAHAPNDYSDGTTTPQPYLHDVTDANGDVVGHFELQITPPPIGSTIVKIRSTGVTVPATVASTTVSRTIQATLAIPSLAKFAVVANDDMRFGEGTEVFGPIHSNGGIRFDGIAHNLITSSRSTYDDPDHDESGAEKLEFGVHTHVDAPPGSGVTESYRSAEMPPSAPAARSDVFLAGRQFPVQAFDFTGMTVDLAQMKADAIENGLYFAASGVQGYRIVLKTNGTFDLYKVKALQAAPGSCSNAAGQDNWGTWSVKTLVNPTNSHSSSPTNYPYPANGIIFVEDDVWVDGQVDDARLTIAAGKFPDNVSTRKSITVNSDLTYSNYDGSDVVSLIAQGDVNVGLFSDNDLRIDGALVAQNGRVGRYYYSNSCRSGGTNYYVRNSITLFGMIATNQRYGFAYTDGTGYDIRNINYDSNLLYGPPPSFPLTSDQYQTISWQEVQ